MNKHRPAALVFAALFALHLLIFAGALWARRPPVWLVLAALAALWLTDFGAFHLALHLDPANLKLHRRACQICALAGYGFLAGYLLLRTTRTDLVPLGALRVVFYELAHGHAGLGLALRQIALPLVSLTPLSFLLPRMAYAARKPLVFMGTMLAFLACCAAAMALLHCGALVLDGLLLAFLGSMIGWVLLWAIPARATGQPSARFWA